MMEDAWKAPGFCVPNESVYPYQWLWDSCFHAIVWTRIDPSRAVKELECSLNFMGESGFVAHMTYWADPDAAVELWHRRQISSITQPPMWGLALTETTRAGQDVGDLVERSAQAILHLLRDRTRTPTGLVPVYHPWETGCDDSPRWDSWATNNQSAKFSREAWMDDKRRLVDSLQFDVHGAPVGNDEFAVGSIGFNSLVAFNAALLSELHPDRKTSQALAEQTAELVTAIRECWDGSIGTWVDETLDGGHRASSSSRTLDAMLALLVDPRPESFMQLVDSEHFGAPYGPRGTHPAEPAYQPNQYWRGPAWPQMTYLLWRAASSAASLDVVPSSVAETLAKSLVDGSRCSGLAEYWNPETGKGFGAKPQSWSGLAICVDYRGRRPDPPPIEQE